MSDQSISQRFSPSCKSIWLEYTGNFSINFWRRKKNESIVAEINWRLLMLIKMFDTLLWFAKKNKNKIAVTDRKATNSIQLAADFVLVVGTDAAAAATDRGTSFIIAQYAWVYDCGAGIR